MKITGIKSICHSKSVRLAPRNKWKEDKIWICLECNQLCEAYFIAELKAE